MNRLPVLYSFRRCPYAIRARMALSYSGIRVELREVNLGDIPDSMLQLSPKATVPVLALPDGRVIDESIDVMHWSLAQSDPQCWLDIGDMANQLIRRNDDEFKPLLDCYKYADRHPEFSQPEHRFRAECFVAELNQRLTREPWLGGKECRLSDIAIFPFIRQFAAVEPDWFAHCEYSVVRNWLNNLLASELFAAVMHKYPLWKPGDAPVHS